MNDDDDLLAGVDLHAWQVPPPVAAHRPSILVRALTPAAPPRRRIGWMIAGAVALNAAVVAILLVLLRPAPPPPVVLPGGGPTVDVKVQELLAKLRAEQAELEQRLAEIKELRAKIEQLSQKVQQYEDRDRQRTVPKDGKQPRPKDVRSTSNQNYYSDVACDEVSCVLSNYEGPCCQRFRKNAAPPPPVTNTLPETLDRASIAAGMAAVKERIVMCGDVNVQGTVKVRVRVEPAGRVTNVVIDRTPDARLGACVAAAVQQATFTKTQLGGSFSYPFVFSPDPN